MNKKNTKKKRTKQEACHYGKTGPVYLVVEWFAHSLVLISLSLFGVELFFNPSEQRLETIERVHIVIAAILLAEFFIRLYLSAHKRYYLRHNWWFLFAAIPLSTALTKTLRSVRLISLVRVATVGEHIIYEKHQQ